MIKVINALMKKKNSMNNENLAKIKKKTNTTGDNNAMRTALTSKEVTPLKAVVVEALYIVIEEMLDLGRQLYGLHVNPPSGSNPIRWQ